MAAVLAQVWQDSDHSYDSTHHVIRTLEHDRRNVYILHGLLTYEV